MGLVACGEKPSETPSIEINTPEPSITKVETTPTVVRSTIDVPLTDFADFPLAGQILNPITGEIIAGGPDKAFNVYRAGQNLVYKRENCTVENREIRFILHLYPVDNALVDGTGRGFINKDFAPAEYFMDGTSCTTYTEIPEFAIKSIRTGQWEQSEGSLWKLTVDGLDES